MTCLTGWSVGRYALLTFATLFRADKTVCTCAFEFALATQADLTPSQAADALCSEAARQHAFGVGARSSVTSGPRSNRDLEFVSANFDSGFRHGGCARRAAEPRRNDVKVIPVQSSTIRDIAAYCRGVKMTSTSMFAQRAAASVARSSDSTWLRPPRLDCQHFSRGVEHQYLPGPMSRPLAPPYAADLQHITGNTTSTASRLHRSHTDQVEAGSREGQ